MEFVYVIGVGLLIAFAIAWNVNAMVWAAFLVALLVEPIASMVAPGVRKIDYAVTMLFFWLWLIVIARIALGKAEGLTVSLPIPVLLFLLFMFSAALGSAYTMDFAESLVGAKGYFQVWVIPFIFYFLIQDERSVRQIAIGLLALSVFQTFVAAIQVYLWHGQPFFGDKLGGAFGNSLGSGALLSVFQLSHILVILGLVKQRCLKPVFGVSLMIWVFTPLLWTHAKAMVLLMPVGLLVVFWSEIKQRPIYALRFIGLGLALTVFLALQYYVEDQYYRPNPEGAPDSFGLFVDQSLGYAVLPGDSGGGLNRGSGLIYWWEKHGLLRNPLETLVGHGMGAAKEQGVVQGHLLSDPNYGRPGMGKGFSRLLWELGVFGVIGFVGVLVTTSTAAARLSNDIRIPAIHRGFLSGYSAVIAMLVIQLFWRSDFVESVTFGTFVMFALGHVFFWKRVTSAEGWKS